MYKNNYTDTNTDYFIIESKRTTNRREFKLKKYTRQNSTIL